MRRGVEKRGGGIERYSEIQCIMGNGHMGPPCEKTDAYENIPFTKLRLQVVVMKNVESVFTFCIDCYVISLMLKL